MKPANALHLLFAGLLFCLPFVSLNANDCACISEQSQESDECDEEENDGCAQRRCRDRWHEDNFLEEQYREVNWPSRNEDFSDRLSR